MVPRLPKRMALLLPGGLEESWDWLATGHVKVEYPHHYTYSARHSSTRPMSTQENLLCPVSSASLILSCDRYLDYQLKRT